MYAHTHMASPRQAIMEEEDKFKCVALGNHDQIWGLRESIHDGQWTSRTFSSNRSRTTQKISVSQRGLSRWPVWRKRRSCCCANKINSSEKRCASITDAKRSNSIRCHCIHCSPATRAAGHVTGRLKTCTKPVSQFEIFRYSCILESGPRKQRVDGLRLTTVGGVMR